MKTTRRNGGLGLAGGVSLLGTMAATVLVQAATQVTAATVAGGAPSAVERPSTPALPVAPPPPRAPAGALAARSSPGVPEVLRMVDAKVEPEVVKAYIRSSPVPYHLSADEIIALRN